MGARFLLILLLTLFLDRLSKLGYLIMITCLLYGVDLSSTYFHNF
jgi:hypothetical protein